MSTRTRSSAKTSTNKKIKKTTEKKEKVEQSSDYYSPPVLDEDIKLENMEGNLLCRWQLGSKGICSKPFDSPDDLINHLLDNHARCGTRGYVCCWKKCPKRSVTHYNTRNEFKNHLKFHTVISPYPECEEENLDGENNSSDENYDEKKAGDSTDSDYVDSSDEEYNTSKRKRRLSKRFKSLTKSKKICSEPVESAKPTKPTVYPTASSSIVRTDRISKDVPPVALTFYRFTCQWVVPFTMRGKSTSQQQSVVCQRKFSLIEESIEHLQGHHLSKLKDQKELLKCMWKGCASKEREFESVETLVEHVLIHTEEKMLTFNSNLTLNEDSSIRKGSTTGPAPVIEMPRLITPAVSLRKSISPVKPVPKVATIELQRPKTSPEKKVNLTWMVSVLRCLISTKIQTGDVTLCGPSHVCLFCRFCSLKNRLATNDTSVPFSMYEFTRLKEKYVACIPNPTKFLRKVLDDVIAHEDVFHAGKSIRDALWVKNVKTDGHACTKHPLNQNLVNLFPVQYKKCPDCTKASEHWPTASHLNLVIKVGALGHIRYPDVLMVKGRVYLLSSVVCLENPNNPDNSYFTYVRVKNMWISYFESSSNVADNSEVFNDKGARILIYTAKTYGRDNVVSITNAPIYDYGDCENKSLKEETSNDINDDNISYTRVIPEDVKPPLAKQMDDRFISLFTYRQLINDGNVSCINAVLQALLQTGLATVVKELCSSSSRCYFCRMFSFMQRAICSPKGTPIQAFELVVHKEELSISDEEGSPGVYISDLIGEIVSDERRHHNSSDAKYRFMIRLQKKSCSCMLSCEAYHWAVSPTKKNESLLDLMAKCSMQCTQCNVMTSVQPIQMPDNLIVTIERNEESMDASVHYPDEWASYNIRYFLAAIIVDDPSYKNGSEHFFTYCKVFGSWMCYDDDKVTKASSSDVLGNKRACVLVYVEKELTPQSLQDALADAHCYSYKKKDIRKDSTIRVKQEPLDY